jgi:hypothetical protein
MSSKLPGPVGDARGVRVQAVGDEAQAIRGPQQERGAVGDRPHGAAVDVLLEEHVDVSAGVEVDLGVAARVCSKDVLVEQRLVRHGIVGLEPELDRALVDQVGVVVRDRHVVIDPIEGRRRSAVRDSRAAEGDAVGVGPAV